MKPKLTLVLALTLIMSMTATASASTPEKEGDFDYLFSNNQSETNYPALMLPIKTDEPTEKEKPKKIEPVVYVVVAGDNLTKIGTAHNVEWQRLWAKNTNLKHPDILQIGDKITIPQPAEQLKRDLPAVVALPVKTPGVAPLRSYDGSNTYDYGYCTWYVKNRRGASLPNGLGNANTWYSRASAMGMAVGSIPKRGAVGTTTRGAFGHVVYVESVNGDGTINISEMNSPTWGKTTYRTANAGEFSYIY